MNASHSKSKRQAWKERAQRWSANCIAAKARKRMMQREVVESPVKCFVPKKFVADAVVTIRLPKQRESVTFSIHRSGGKFIALGKIQAASTIAKRIQLVLENLT